MTPYDASNRKDVRRAEKLDAELTESNTLFLRAMMDTVQGRRWLYHHLAECQVFVEVPAFDPHRDYFAAGRRSVGLPLMATLQTNCPDQYLWMIREENDRLAARTAATERSRSPVPDGGDLGRDDGDLPDDDDHVGAYSE